MNVVSLSATALLLTIALSACAQERSKTPAALGDLIEEARRSNAQIAAAEHAWRAAGYAAQQLSTLPDPQFTLQQFSVGSPKPFAGFTNSNFAYIGFGASQELPYPGKLRLKGEVARREAGAEQEQASELRALISEQVKLAYFHLAYLQETLQLLQRTGSTLDQLTRAELARYQTGQGSQAEVFKAQLEHTKLVRQITMNNEALEQYQAELKLLLHRPQQSSDIVAENLTLTPLDQGAPELLALVEDRNPTVQSGKATLRKEDAQLQSAERDRKPDFSVGYMFQETDSRYRDYYMLTLGMNLPRRRRVNAEVAEAAELRQKAHSSLDADRQQQLSEVQKQYVSVTTSGRLLTEYRDGLVPQTQSVLRAQLSAYRSDTGPLSSVLLALADVLSLEREQAEALLDHETAIARLETLTGATLR